MKPKELMEITAIDELQVLIVEGEKGHEKYDNLTLTDNTCLMNDYGDSEVTNIMPFIKVTGKVVYQAEPRLRVCVKSNHH